MAGEVGRESNRSKPLKVLNKELGDFILLDRVGEGGMGTVFRATQKSLNRLVAVKILSPRIAKNAEFIVRFEREARAAAALSHPNIVRAITVGEDQGFHYFVMEFLEGETVRQRFKREGSLPLRDVLEIGRQTALALAHAHRKGILHRDIKPENLMLMQGAAELTVKVMDLGLARLVREDGCVTQTGMALGTPLYNSPEQARGMQKLSPACDLYSLGATLFHLATGKPPFEGASAVELMTKHVTEPPPDPKKLNSSLPDEFCTLLLQLLAKKPEERYESAALLAEDLQALIDAESSPGSGERGSEGDGALSARQGAARARPVLRRRGFGKRGQGVEANPLVLAGAGLALLVLCIPILSLFSSRPESTRRSPETAAPKTVTQTSYVSADPQRERLDAMLSAALDLEKNQPDDPEAQRRAWTELKRVGLGWRQGSQAETKLKELDAKLAAAGAQALNDVIAKARDQAAKGDYNAALALLDTFSQRYQQGPNKEQVDTATTEIQAKAKAAGEALLKQAADLEAAGQRQGAFEAYTAAARFKYEPVSSRAAQKVEALKGTIDSAKEQAKQAAAQQLVALIKRLRQSTGPRQFDLAHEEINKALSDPVCAPRAQALKALDACVRSVPEFYPFIEKRLAQNAKRGLAIPGSPALYLRLDNGRLYYKPAPDFPVESNKPLEALKPAELAALSGIAEAEGLSAIPAAKLGVFGAFLVLVGQNKAAQRLFERGIGEGQAALEEWTDVLAGLDAEETESLAAKAWADAEALFAKKQYEAAHLAYLAFKAEYAASRTLSDKNAALAERLGAIEALAKPQPRTETESAVKPQPKSETNSTPLAKASWQGADIGKTGLKGSFSEAAGTITVKGSGTDIGGGADAFQFVSQPLDGDGEIKARVTAVEDTHLGAKAGVMIRESLAADSKHVLLAISAAKGVIFLRRSTIGGTSAHTNAQGAAPYWVRLVRAGDTFTAYMSADGAAWKLLGTDSFVMAHNAYAGLAVTAENNGALNTSTFDNLTLAKPDQAAHVTAPPIPEEPATPAPPAKTTAPTEASWAKALNLVPLVNPARDAIAGAWRLQGGKLLSDRSKNARLEFPYQPPEEYDVRLTFSRLGGEDEVALILSKAGRSFAYVMGGKGGTLFGLQSVGDRPYDKNSTTVTRLSWSKPGEKHVCTVQVRNDCLKVFLDDEQVLDHSTGYKDVQQGNAGPWKLSHNTALGIGSALSPTFFNSLEVLEITGKGKLTR